MRTFQEFYIIAEAVYDASVMSSSQIRKTGEGGRIGADRKKSAPERRRVKAVGGGKTEPAADYKPRSDIGTQRQASTRVQQPTKERGSADVKAAAAAAAKEERKKAAQARIAAKKAGGSATTEKPKPKQAEKTATQLLSKKEPTKVSPTYKPQKASGLSTQERKALYKKGERTLRDLVISAQNEKRKKEGKPPITSEKELKHKFTSK